MQRIAWIAAVVAGVAGFALLSTYKHELEARAAGGAPVAVLTATEDIPLGTPITEDVLAVRELPAAYVEGRHVRADDARKIIGVRVVSGLRAGESLLWTDLQTMSADRRELSGLVQRGMRAVTIRASSGSSLSSLLRPGDRVDVLITTQREGRAVTLPLLQNVMVLAVGNQLSRSGDDDRRARLQRDITLSATVAQAQALVHASSGGSLSVVLRNPDDIAVADDVVETSAASWLGKDGLKRLRRHAGDSGTKVEGGQEIEHVR